MCLAFPAKVIKIKGKKVLVRDRRGERYVLSAGEKIKPGDSVLIQMGIIIQKNT